MPHICTYRTEDLFDGYELLRSNDEVEETVSSQFISALFRPELGLELWENSGALLLYGVEAFTDNLF